MGSEFGTQFRFLFFWELKKLWPPAGRFNICFWGLLINFLPRMVLIGDFIVHFGFGGEIECVLLNYLLVEDGTCRWFLGILGKTYVYITSLSVTILNFNILDPCSQHLRITSNITKPEKEGIQICLSLQGSRKR